MKFRLVVLAFMLSIPPMLVSSTIANSRDTGSQGGCFPGTYVVVEGSGTQSLWTLSQDGAFQVTSSAERAFGFSHIQGVWKKTGARDAKATGLDFNFSETPVDGGVPPSQIARLDIVIRIADRCEEIEGRFELRAFGPDEDPLSPNTPAITSDTFLRATGENRLAVRFGRHLESAAQKAPQRKRLTARRERQSRSSSRYQGSIKT